MTASGTEPTPRIAQRLQALPPYPFEEIDRKKAAAREAGVDLVDLGVGDPDQPTPPHIIDALAAAVRNPEHHRYPAYRGTAPFRQAVARYLAQRFDVQVDSEAEVLALIGSKEGIAHLALALVNPGDVVLVPDPAYPVYASSAEFLGAEAVRMPLSRENGFLPRLEDIPAEAAARASLLWVNYPNNPLGAVAPRSFFQELGAFAAEHDLVVACDAAYAEIYLEGEPPLSGLQVPALRERLVEFHSLSKTFNMTGWRVGFATGTPWVVQALGTVKTNVDSGVFGAVQEAAIAALQGSWEPVQALRARYRARRDQLVTGLRAAGIEAVPMPATFYVVAAVPAGHTAASYAGELLERAGIVCTPCSAFGAGGEGYVRFSLTAADERIALAAERLRELGEG
jgi:LL-diaminopimelate aminotransferase